MSQHMTAAAACVDFAPRRGNSRLRVGIPAAFETVNGQQTITLVDLSQSGARLQIHDSEPVGRGVLKWVGFEAFGTVVRREGNEIGLQFETPLEPAWVLYTKEWLSARPSAKDELRHFAQDWVSGGAAPGPTFGTQAPRAPARPDMVARAPGKERTRHRMGEWYRAGRPFVLGGALLGAIAGYCSNFL